MSDIVIRAITDEVTIRRPHWICGVPERGDRLGIARVVALRCGLNLADAQSQVDGFLK